MSENNPIAAAQYYFIKGAIQELDVEDREKIDECVEKIEKLMAEYDKMGYLALALSALKIQMEGKL